THSGTATIVAASISCWSSSSARRSAARNKWRGTCSYPVSVLAPGTTEHECPSAAPAPSAILVARGSFRIRGWRCQMKRLAAVLLSIAALALAAAGATLAADGSYGPWEATYQGPITAPAGVVCPFTVTAEPVREDLRVRYHYDAGGNVDGYEASGQLVGRITNTATGTSVVRNLSGPGTVTF